MERIIESVKQTASFIGDKMPKTTLGKLLLGVIVALVAWIALKDKQS